MAEYDNTNRGALYNANEDLKIIKNGKANIGGKDDQFLMVTHKTHNGKTFMELWRNIGLVYVNDKKSKDSQPDMTGNATTDGVEYRVAGWKKESKNGNPYTGIVFTEKDDDGKQGGQKSGGGGGSADTSDDIPF